MNTDSANIDAPARKRVRVMMRRDYVFCREDDDHEAALQLMREKGLDEIPVLDAHYRMVGMLSRDHDGGSSASA
jgi:predicted transcriptional regulator